MLKCPAASILANHWDAKEREAWGKGVRDLFQISLHSSEQAETAQRLYITDRS